MLMEVSKWVVLALIIIVAIFIIKAGLKIINIIIIVALLGFVWFSFFTEIGCVRLTIALYGHPIIGYTTKLERQDNMSNEKEIYYKPETQVIVNNKVKQYIKIGCNGLVRIPIIEE